MREFRVCLHKGPLLVYEFFFHDDGIIMEQEIYAKAHINEGIQVIDILKASVLYYQKVVADSYEVIELPQESEYQIEMKRGGNLFRAYLFHENNFFEPTTLETLINIDDFQENNKLNKLVVDTMREWSFDKFELTRV